MPRQDHDDLHGRPEAKPPTPPAPDRGAEGRDEPEREALWEFVHAVAHAEDNELASIVDAFLAKVTAPAEVRAKAESETADRLRATLRRERESRADAYKRGYTEGLARGAGNAAHAIEHARKAGYDEATEHAAMWCADHVGPDAARSLRRGAHRRHPEPNGPEPAKKPGQLPRCDHWNGGERCTKDYGHDDYHTGRADGSLWWWPAATDHRGDTWPAHMVADHVLPTEPSPKVQDPAVVCPSGRECTFGCRDVCLEEPNAGAPRRPTEHGGQPEAENAVIVGIVEALDAGPTGAPGPTEPRCGRCKAPAWWASLCGRTPCGLVEDLAAAAPTEPCSLCNDTGVVHHDTTDLPCPCPAGAPTNPGTVLGAAAARCYDTNRRMRPLLDEHQAAPTEPDTATCDGCLLPKPLDRVHFGEDAITCDECSAELAPETPAAAPAGFRLFLEVGRGWIAMVQDEDGRSYFPTREWAADECRRLHPAPAAAPQGAGPGWKVEAAAWLRGRESERVACTTLLCEHVPDEGVRDVLIDDVLGALADVLAVRPRNWPLAAPSAPQGGPDPRREGIEMARAFSLAHGVPMVSVEMIEHWHAQHGAAWTVKPATSTPHGEPAGPDWPSVVRSLLDEAEGLDERDGSLVSCCPWCGAGTNAATHEPHEPDCAGERARALLDRPPHGERPEPSPLDVVHMGRERYAAAGGHNGAPAPYVPKEGDRVEWTEHGVVGAVWPDKPTPEALVNGDAGGSYLPFTALRLVRPTSDEPGWPCEHDRCATYGRCMMGDEPGEVGGHG